MHFKQRALTLPFSCSAHVHPIHLHMKTGCLPEQRSIQQITGFLQTNIASSMTPPRRRRLLGLRKSYEFHPIKKKRSWDFFYFFLLWCGHLPAAVSHFSVFRPLWAKKWTRRACYEWRPLDGRSSSCHLISNYSQMKIITMRCNCFNNLSS